MLQNCFFQISEWNSQSFWNLWQCFANKKLNEEISIQKNPKLFWESNPILLLTDLTTFRWNSTSAILKMNYMTERTKQLLSLKRFLRFFKLILTTPSRLRWRSRCKAYCWWRRTNEETKHLWRWCFYPYSSTWNHVIVDRYPATSHHLWFCETWRHQ